MRRRGDRDAGLDETVAAGTSPLDTTVAANTSPLRGTGAASALDETVAAGTSPLDETLAAGTPPLDETVAANASPLRGTGTPLRGTSARSALDETVGAGTSPLDETVRAGTLPLDETVAAGTSPLDETLAAGTLPLDETVAAGSPSPAGTGDTLAGGAGTRPGSPDLAVTSNLAKVIRDSRPTLRREQLDRGDTLGRYVVLAQLGAGGMGEVYTAYDPELDRRVALKVIRPASDAGSTQSAQARLLDEAKALAKLSHPNVVAVHDVGAYEGDVFIAMEHVEGESLGVWLAKRKRTWREIVDVIVAAGRGLEAAHAAGLVHRDIKPDNIMVGNDGRVRVLDFGVALAARTPQAGSGGALVGTPAYMAPEQFEHEPIGPYTDQFSLGVTLYEALWEQKPFEGDSLAELWVHVAEGRLKPPPPSDVPARIEAAVVRALARKPEDRFPSLAAMLAALVPPQRSRWPWIAAAVAIAGAAAGAFAIARAGGDHDSACRGFERELAGVWDPARKSAVEQALAARPQDRAGIVKIVDEYAAAWTARKTEACRATRVTRAQSEAVMQQRMACLDTRRRELDAVIAIVVAPTPGAKAPGIESVANLSSLATCDNLAALGHGGPPATLAPQEVRELEDAEARGRALRLAGAYKQAREHAAALAERMERAGWSAASARVLVERGTAENLDGDPRAARETFFEAIRRAAAARDDASEAQAWVALAGVETAGLRQPSEALRWAKHAEVALERAGNDHEQRALLLHHTGGALRLLGRHEEGLAKLLESRALFVHALGPTHYRVALESGAISNAYRTIGKLDLAIREGEAALAALSAVLGDKHPALGSMLNNLAIAYDNADRIDDARALLERSIVLKEQELGKQHPSLAASLLNLASIERRAGRFDIADAMWQRAHDLRVAALGARHPDVTRTLNIKLIDRTGRGLDDEALELSREVIARFRAQPDSTGELGATLAIHCELLRRAGRLDAAAKACAEALETLRDDTDARRITYALAFAARAATARGALDEARNLVARAHEALGKIPRERELAEAHVRWAAAHLALAEQRPADAAAEARLARPGFAAEGQARTYYLADLDRAFSR